MLVDTVAAADLEEPAAPQHGGAASHHVPVVGGGGHPAGRVQRGVGAEHRPAGAAAHSNPAQPRGVGAVPVLRPCRLVAGPHRALRRRRRRRHRGRRGWARLRAAAGGRTPSRLACHPPRRARRRAAGRWCAALLRRDRTRPRHPEHLLRLRRRRLRRRPRLHRGRRLRAPPRRPGPCRLLRRGRAVDGHPAPRSSLSAASLAAGQDARAGREEEERLRRTRGDAVTWSSCAANSDPYVILLAFHLVSHSPTATRHGESRH